jgi:hypothetical protein
MYPTIEITMPISPSRMAVLTRYDSPYVRKDGNTGVYRDVTLPEVDESNRRTRFYCDQHFVSNCRLANPFWLDPGRLPPGYGTDA